MYGPVSYRNIHIPILGRLLGCLILFQSSSEATALLASDALRFLQQFMENQKSKTSWCGLHPSEHRHLLMGLYLLLPSLALTATSRGIPALVLLQKMSALLKATSLLVKSTSISAAPRPPPPALVARSCS